MKKLILIAFAILVILSCNIQHTEILYDKEVTVKVIECSREIFDLEYCKLLFINKSEREIENIYFYLHGFKKLKSKPQVYKYRSDIAELKSLLHEEAKTFTVILNQDLDFHTISVDSVEMTIKYKGEDIK